MEEYGHLRLSLSVHMRVKFSLLCVCCQDHVMVASIFPLSYTEISTWDLYVVVSDPKLWLSLKQALLLHSFDVRVALEVAFFPVFITWP